MTDEIDYVYYACTTPGCEFKGQPVPTPPAGVPDIEAGTAVCGSCHRPGSMKPCDPPETS
jgi:hypothetical protein